MESDHNLLMAKCNIFFKKRRNLNKVKKWCLENLKDHEKIKLFKEELGNCTTEANTWEEVRENIVKVTDKVIGKNKLEPKKPWMTKDILDMIIIRNKLRNADYIQYKKVKNEVSMKCREAKEKWLDENIKEIEVDLLLNNTSRVYNKVKNLQYKPKTRRNIVRDKDGKILFENNKVVERWKEYMEELYQGEDIADEEEY